MLNILPFLIIILKAELNNLCLTNIPHCLSCYSASRCKICEDGYVQSATQKWNESVQNIENHIAFSHLFDDEVISSSLSSFIDIFDIYPDFY